MTPIPVTLPVAEPALPAPLPPLDPTTARRSFTFAQDIFAGQPRFAVGTMEVGWHDTEVSPERGAYAVVRDGSDLMELVGEVLRVATEEQEARVYVLSVAGVERDLSLARRAFLALAPLASESVLAEVQIV